MLDFKNSINFFLEDISGIQTTNIAKPFLVLQYMPLHTGYIPKIISFENKQSITLVNEFGLKCR